MGRPKAIDPKVTVSIQLRRSTIDWFTSRSELRPINGEARSVSRYIADLLELHERSIKAAGQASAEESVTGPPPAAGAAQRPPTRAPRLAGGEVRTHFKGGQ